MQTLQTEDEVHLSSFSSINKDKIWPLPLVIKFSYNEETDNFISSVIKVFFDTSYLIYLRFDGFYVNISLIKLLIYMNNPIFQTCVKIAELLELHVPYAYNILWELICKSIDLGEQELVNESLDCLKTLLSQPKIPKESQVNVAKRLQVIQIFEIIPSFGVIRKKNNGFLSVKVM